MRSLSKDFRLGATDASTVSLFLKQATRVLLKRQTVLALLIGNAIVVGIFGAIYLQGFTTSSASSEVQKNIKVLATSGRLYKIQATRSVDPKRLKFQDRQHHGYRGIIDDDSWPEGSFWNKEGCSKWGVTTTIFPVTEAAANVARMPGWCLVVAGDQKGPESYDVKGGKVVFLSQERQQELEQTLAFVEQTPWNHFARKNIAYLYAIANGAEFVWDFDDDNSLFPGEDLQKFTNASNGHNVIVLQIENVNNKACGSFNPYHFFGPTVDSIWPRGYPLDDIQKAECQLNSSYCRRVVPATNIGIYQSIADRDPDVDAIYRLTRDLPVHFSGAPENFPVVVPPNTLSPMNAQAALFHRSAMWSLFLPTTVHGRVSDIWRSYFTQTLAKRHGILSTFMGPIVEQVRNVHSYLADMDAEIPLYERSGALIAYLLEWDYEDTDNFEGAMERLYADLYEREIIEWNDVRLIQLWISTLGAIGYTFPSIDKALSSKRILEGTCADAIADWQTKKTTGSRYDNVVLVGQFNYDTDVKYVMHWVSRWSEIFRHVQVRGPFNSTSIAILQANGVNVFWGDDDAGYYSPMKNLAETLKMYADDKRIRGVLLSHDDLIFNVTHLQSLGFPSSTDILSQTFPNVVERPYLEFTNHYKYRRFGESKLHNVSDFNFGRGKGARLKPWRWWKHCLPGFAKGTSADPRGAQFAGKDGTVAMYANSVGDFAYVPTSLAKPFAEMADWLVDNKVFLECGMPTLVGHLKEKHDATAKFVHYCTSFRSDRIDYTKWLPSCARGDEQTQNYYFPQPLKPVPPYGLYHPVKMAVHGTSVWDTNFDLVNPSK